MTLQCQEHEKIEIILYEIPRDKIDGASIMTQQVKLLPSTPACLAALLLIQRPANDLGKSTEDIASTLCLCRPSGRLT